MPFMQHGLFHDTDQPAAAPARPPSRQRLARIVLPVETEAHGALRALAEALPAHVRLGTSSWTYPGWKGIVWEDDHSSSQLAKQGLSAYAAHPLLRTVCIDRTFYRPLSAPEYAEFAHAVGPDFRFMVKAPSVVTDALVRDDKGRGLQPNPLFLDPRHAVEDFIQPALEGLGARCGALVFQLSPVGARWLADPDQLWRRLEDLLANLPALRAVAPDAVVAVEVRDGALLTPALAAVLRRHGATYCLGLHAKLPPLAQQLPLLRALWPGPLVCRWNYHRRHGAHGFEVAEQVYAPFNRMIDPDPATREALARVIHGTAQAGQRVQVAISNKAEGSAPLSVVALAEAVRVAGAG